MIEMEYADGGTLAQMLSRRARRLDEREILMLFRQIVAAIRYMHDHNILHRYIDICVNASILILIKLLHILLSISYPFQGSEDSKCIPE